MFGESPLCEKCNLPFWDDHKSTCVKQTCKCIYYQNTVPELAGWICPACKGGVAPGVNRCPCTPMPITVNPAYPQPFPCNPFPLPYLQYYWNPGFHHGKIW